MVERFNKTMKGHLSKVVAKNQRDWDQQLPLLLMAYRSAVYESTCQSPAKVIFGKDLKLPRDLMFDSPEAKKLEVYDYADELQERLLKIHKMVREQIQLSSNRMKSRYDIRANSARFHENDMVWLTQQEKRGCRRGFLSPGTGHAKL